MTSYIGAVDQGTTSTRFSIFDKTGRIVAWDQKEHRQIFPRPGWVEHDPEEIWQNTKDVIQRRSGKRRDRRRRYRGHRHYQPAGNHGGVG